MSRQTEDGAEIVRQGLGQFMIQVPAGDAQEDIFANAANIACPGGWEREYETGPVHVDGVMMTFIKINCT